MSQCVVWLSGTEMWGGDTGHLVVGSRFTSGLCFHEVRRTTLRSRTSSGGTVSRIAESGLMHVSARMDSWAEGGSRLDTRSTVGVSLFVPAFGTDFGKRPTSSAPFVGEGALTLAPSGRWAGLRPWEHSVPEAQIWTVDEVFAFRGPGAPPVPWLDDWQRREAVPSLDIDVFDPDDSCALVISPSPTRP